MSRRFRIDPRLALVIDLIVLVGVWQLAVVTIDRPFLPGPLTVARTFVAELGSGLLHHAWISTQRVLLSVFLGTVVAAPLAILAAENRVLDNFLSPLIYFLYPTPKVVFLPIIVVLVGLGNPSIIFLITLIVFFQIFVIIRDAVGRVPQATLDSVASLGAGRLERLRYVYLPLSLGAVMTAIKVSIGTAIAVLFIAESIGNNVGLGYYIVVEQWNRFAYARMYAGILAIALLGSLMFALVSWGERVANRWQSETGSAR